MGSNDMKDDEFLRQYLLGELGEEQADVVEERLLRDGDFFELAEAVEGDLLAAAARRELSPAMRGRVLRRLARSPEGRSRYALARGLAAMSPEPVPAEVLMFQLAARPWVRAAAAAASVAFVGVGLWLGTIPYRHVEHNLAGRRPPIASPQPLPPTPPVDQIAEQAPAPMAPAPEADRIDQSREPVASPEPEPWIFQLAFASPVRSAGEESDLPEMNPPDTGRVEIHLSVEGEPFASFVASLRNEAAGFRREERLTAREVGGQKMIILSVPAADLVPGTYEVEVRGATEEANLVGTSTFEVASN